MPPRLCWGTGPQGSGVYSTLWLLPLLGTEYPGQEVESVTGLRSVNVAPRSGELSRAAEGPQPEARSPSGWGEAKLVEAREQGRVSLEGKRVTKETTAQG